MYPAFYNLRNVEEDAAAASSLLISAIGQNLSDKVAEHIFEGVHSRVWLNIVNRNKYNKAPKAPFSHSVEIALARQTGELGALRIMCTFALANDAQDYLLARGLPALFPNNLGTEVSFMLSQPVEEPRRGRPQIVPPTIQADVILGRYDSGHMHVCTFNISTNLPPVSGGMSTSLTDIPLRAWDDICVILVEAFFLHCAQGSIYAISHADASNLYEADDDDVELIEDEDASIESDDSLVIEGPFVMTRGFHRIPNTLNTLTDSGVTLTPEIVTQVSRKTYLTARDRVAEVKQDRVMEILASAEQTDEEQLRAVAIANTGELEDLRTAPIEDMTRAELLDLFNKAASKFRYLVVPCSAHNTVDAWHDFLNGEYVEGIGYEAEAADDLNYALTADVPALPDERDSDEDEWDPDWDAEEDEEEEESLLMADFKTEGEERARPVERRQPQNARHPKSSHPASQKHRKEGK